MYSYCKHQAFTLLEMLIIMTIMAIIVMIAVPSFHNIRESQELTTLFPTIQQNVNFARNTAQSFHTNTVMCSSSSMLQCETNQWNKGILIFSDINKNKTIDENEIIHASIQTHLKYGNLKWNGGATSPNIVTFQGDSGLPLGSFGHFSYCSFNKSQNNRYIPLSPMGHIRIENNGNC